MPMLLCKPLHHPHHRPRLALSKVTRELIVAYRSHDVRNAEKFEAAEEGLDRGSC